MVWAVGNLGTPVDADNADVTPTLPTHNEGDILIAVAAIRGPGAGSDNVSESGATWTELLDLNGIGIFGKVAGASEGNPTFQFTGGSAGHTTIGWVMQTTGGSLTTEDSNSLNNAVDTDVPYPTLTIGTDDCLLVEAALIFDNLNVTPHPAGYTEDLDYTTATGLDACLSVVHLIQTTAANTTAHSGTISAPVNSDSVAIALRQASASGSHTGGMMMMGVG